MKNRFAAVDGFMSPRRFSFLWNGGIAAGNVTAQTG
jgi:hypothetical protein